MRVQKEAHETAWAQFSRLTDEELITAFQQDVGPAFSELVARYKDPLTNFVFRFVGDRDDCDDIVQETFVRVYKNKHSYKPIAKFSTWIYTIATNLAKTQLRRRKVRSLFSFGRGEQDSSLLDVADEQAGPDRVTDSSLKAEHIQKALDALPVKFREVIVMRDVQELSYEEIAAVTGLNIGTVKSRINRARSQLQEMLKDIME